MSIPEAPSCRVNPFFIEGLNSEEKCEKWPVEKCDVENKKVKKFLPQTKCSKIPREVCTQGVCGLKEVKQETLAQ